MIDKELLEFVYRIHLIMVECALSLISKCTIVSQSKPTKEKSCITVITGQSNTLILSMRSTPS